MSAYTTRAFWQNTAEAWDQLAAYRDADPHTRQQAATNARRCRTRVQEIDQKSAERSTKRPKPQPLPK